MKQTCTVDTKLHSQDAACEEIHRGSEVREVGQAGGPGALAGWGDAQHGELRRTSGCCSVHGQAGLPGWGHSPSHSTRSPLAAALPRVCRRTRPPRRGPRRDMAPPELRQARWRSGSCRTAGASGPLSADVQGGPGTRENIPVRTEVPRPGELSWRGDVLRHGARGPLPLVKWVLCVTHKCGQSGHHFDRLDFLT